MYIYYYSTAPRDCIAVSIVTFIDLQENLPMVTQNKLINKYKASHISLHQVLLINGEKKFGFQRLGIWHINKRL